jgi:hypothetical protein
MSAVRTDRMPATASADNLMLFCVQQTASRGHMCQRDRFAELAAGYGSPCRGA